MQLTTLLQLLLRTRELSEAPDEGLLGQLRALERKMGFVLTLVRVAQSSCLLTGCSSTHPQFKASVWAAINDRKPVAEDEHSYDEDESGLDRTVTR